MGGRLPGCVRRRSECCHRLRRLDGDRLRSGLQQGPGLRHLRHLDCFGCHHVGHRGQVHGGQRRQHCQCHPRGDRQLRRGRSDLGHVQRQHASYGRQVPRRCCGRHGERHQAAGVRLQRLACTGVAGIGRRLQEPAVRPLHRRPGRLDRQRHPAPALRLQRRGGGAVVGTGWRHDEPATGRPTSPRASRRPPPRSRTRAPRRPAPRTATPAPAGPPRPATRSGSRSTSASPNKHHRRHPHLEAAYAKAFQIQTSADGTNWTSIYKQPRPAPAAPRPSASPAPGATLRMYGTVRATQYGYSLWELGVAGTPGGGTTNPTLLSQGQAHHRVFGGERRHPGGQRDGRQHRHPLVERVQ